MILKRFNVEREAKTEAEEKALIAEGFKPLKAEKEAPAKKAPAKKEAKDDGADK